MELPSGTTKSFDVAVAGGGVIGLAVAWRAAQRGARVVVLDARRDGAAWPVSAGMLAPVAEAEFGHDDLLVLGLESARRWPRFASELAAAADVDPGYRHCGTLVVARDRDEAEALERELAYRLERDLAVERLRGTEARRREPALTPGLRLALDAPDDHAVDPRTLRAALVAAVRRAGSEVREDAEVVRGGSLGDGIAARAGASAGGTEAGAARSGVRLADGTEVRAERVVVATGAWTGSLAGVPIRPVKGQVLRLRDPAGPGLVDRVIRMAESYLVPRGDGHYVLGATMEERGFDTALTAGGVFELLRDAYEVVPGLVELELEDASVGLRPATPDNGPLIGTTERTDVVLAAGHHRNGILLTPITADAIAAILAGDEPPEEVAPFGAHRFAGGPTPNAQRPTPDARRPTPDAQTLA
jgi:glycine oxidase